MLRAYRKTFMGTPGERWKDVVDLRPALRVPVVLVVGALLCYGFFPQSLVRMVTPVFRTYLTANSHLTNTQRCSHGGVSAKGAEFIANLGQPRQDQWNKKTPALKARLTESRLQRLYWYDRIPGALPQAHLRKAPLALNECGVVRRSQTVTPDEGTATQGRGYNICEVVVR
jgi:hypothetical protein